MANSTHQTQYFWHQFNLSFSPFKFIFGNTSAISLWKNKSAKKNNDILPLILPLFGPFFSMRETGNHLEHIDFTSNDPVQAKKKETKISKNASMIPSSCMHFIRHLFVDYVTWLFFPIQYIHRFFFSHIACQIPR